MSKDKEIMADSQLSKQNKQDGNLYACKEKGIEDFIARKKCELQKLLRKFCAIWQIGLLWDSKVPEKDKWLFNFISFKASDQKEVIKEIERYQKLYEEICDMENVRNGGESIHNGYLQIQDLYEKLSSIVKRAETERKNTSSSAVYNLHKDIIARKEQIVKNIGKAELSVSRQLLQGLANKSESAIKASEENKQQIKTLEQQNKEIKEKCKLVVDENMKLGEKCDRVVEENKELGEKCDRVVECNKKLEEKCHMFVEENRKLREEIQNFLQEMGSHMINEGTAQNEANNLGASTIHQLYAQTDKQQESDTQVAANEQPSNKLSEITNTT